MPRVTKAKTNTTAKSAGKSKVVSSDIEKKLKKKTTKKASASEIALKDDVKKKTTPKKATTKKTTSKKSTTAKKTTKKASTKKTAKKTTTKKRNPAKKVISKTLTSRKRTPAKNKEPKILEYYDLPYRYNQTIVKILAQTPTTLFVYWDISDFDRQKYIEEFGENFFNDTVPVLIIHNKTMQYSFEVEINDFANSWYLSVADAKCVYDIELGRRKKQYRSISIPHNYVYITTSNDIESPNNRFLFDPNARSIYFRNVKTNQEFSKDIAEFSFMQKISQIYNIYDIYKKIYKEEDLIDAINNPTSFGSSSVFYKKD